MCGRGLVQCACATVSVGADRVRVAPIFASVHLSVKRNHARSPCNVWSYTTKRVPFLLMVQFELVCGAIKEHYDNKKPERGTRQKSRLSDILALGRKLLQLDQVQGQGWCFNRKPGETMPEVEGFRRR